MRRSSVQDCVFRAGLACTTCQHVSRSAGVSHSQIFCLSHIETFGRRAEPLCDFLAGAPQLTKFVTGYKLIAGESETPQMAASAQSLEMQIQGGCLMIRTTSFSALVAFAISTTGAWAQSGDIAVVMKTLSNPYWGAMGEGVEAGSEATGLVAVVQDAPNETDIAAQLNSCLNLLTRQPAGLVVAAITPVNLLPCIREANSTGVPVADLDNQLDPDILDAEGVEIAFAIGSDNRGLGSKAADYLASMVDEGKVLVIEGTAGNPPGMARRDGFRDRIAEIAPGIDIVAVLPGDWDRLKAANITNDVLQANPDLVGIYAANDTMALGAVEALRTAGAKERVVVIGTDGNSDAIEAVREGTLDATVAQLPFLVGQQAIETIQMVRDGQIVDQRIVVPTLVVTRDVLEAEEDPLLAFLR